MTLGDGVEEDCFNEYTVTDASNYYYGYIDGYTKSWPVSGDAVTSGTVEDWGGGGGTLTAWTAGHYDLGVSLGTDTYTEYSVSDAWDNDWHDNCLYICNTL